MSTVDFFELNTKGWSTVYDVHDTDALVSLASQLGEPISTSKGLVSCILPKESKDALEGTFGKTYGLSQYPLHTDTAHWPIPAKYVILHACGDIRRNTTLLSVRSLLSLLDEPSKKQLEKAIWCSGNLSARFYCLTSFKADNFCGWRFDPMCMSPANKSAKNQFLDLIELLNNADREHHCWAKNTALIISNWTTLHGRGSMPIDEEERKLYRVLVR